MADSGKFAFQPGEQLMLGAALDDLGEKGAALGQNLAGEIGGEFDKADDAQLIGFLMPGRIGRHVGKDDIGLAAEPLHKLLRRILGEKIHDLELDARQRLHVEKIDADDPAFALLRANLARRHLRPAAGRRAKIDDPLAGF